MNKQQLVTIKKFAQPFYLKTGKYHAWDHIVFVEKAALKIANEFKITNTDSLRAAVYLHDIGRVNKDKGHSQESVRLFDEFLSNLNLSKTEVEEIIDAVSHHEKEQIKMAKTIIAKILFDADKLHIVTLKGFIRCWFWLVEERKMGYKEAANFLFKYILDVKQNFLFSNFAKEICEKDYFVIKQIVESL